MSDDTGRGDAPLRSLYSSRAGLHAIATRHGMTLGDLASWATAPERARSIAATCALADAHVALSLGRARAAAAVELLRLAKRATSEETRRKACADLLRLEARASGVTGAPPSGAMVGAEACEITQEQEDRFLAAFGAAGLATDEPAHAVNA